MLLTGNSVNIRAAARLELSNVTTDVTTWTEAELKGFIDRVTGDISRLLPLEKVVEYTIGRDDATDESVTTAAAHGTWKALTYKPIKPGSETVTSSPAGTTYTRDTDYRMDYFNGQITTISGGSMAISTAYLIDYEIDRLAWDISGLSNFISVYRVEAPLGVPQNFDNFFVWASILWLTERAGTSQLRLKENDHLRIYYYADHTAPAETARGTFPVYLDEVMVKGVVAYALFMKHREANLQSITDEDSSRTAFAAAIARAGTITTLLTDADTAIDQITGALALIYGSAGEPIDDAITALNKVSTHAATEADAALDKVTTELTGGTRHADDYLNSGDALINAVNLGSDVAELYRRYASTKIDSAMAWIGEAEQRISMARTFIEESNSRVAVGNLYATTAQARVEEGKARLAIAAEELNLWSAYIFQGRAYLEAADHNSDTADRFLVDARERYADYVKSLEEKVQQARRGGSSTRQYAQLP